MYSIFHTVIDVLGFMALVGILYYLLVQLVYLIIDILQE